MSIVDTMNAYFEERKLTVVPINGTDGVGMNFAGENARWSCIAVPTETGLSFFSVCPVTIPENYRSLVMEYVIRVNNRLPTGNFDLDLDDGELRMKTGIDVEGGELTKALVNNVVMNNLAMMDHYVTGVLKILHGGLTVPEALDALP